MKTSKLLEYVRSQDQGELITNFGEARLLKHLDGKFELLGGSRDDRATALEWCSRFLDKDVFTAPPDSAESKS